MKLEVGTKVEVIAEEIGHEFDIGEIVTCARIEDNGIHWFKSDDGDTWFMVYDEYTVIEHHEPKQHGIGYTMTKAEIGFTGTLAELGVQVGDVVELVGGHHGVYFDSLVGGHYTIKDGVAGVAAYDNKREGEYVPFDTGWAYRLISRAQPKGPVITETVKRIVPGVYGRIAISKNTYNDDTVLIRLADSCGEYDEADTGHYMSRDDLTAAIDTLTAVKDAMPHQSHA